MEISAVLPAFNEEANLEQSVGRMAQALEANARNSEIIVVDDGSLDQTPFVLERMASLYPTLRVVRHPHNRGYEAAVRSGFAAARCAWVFLMDADNQYDPSELSLLLHHAAEADIVTGYRKHRRDPVLRRLNAWAFFTLVRFFFGPRRELCVQADAPGSANSHGPSCRRRVDQRRGHRAGTSPERADHRGACPLSAAVRQTDRSKPIGRAPRIPGAARISRRAALAALAIENGLGPALSRQQIGVDLVVRT